MQSNRKDVQQKIAIAIVTLLSWSIVAIIVILLGFIFVNGLKKISWEFISQAPTDGMMKGGLLPAILGTLLLVLGSTLLAFPIGILSGIYMQEYAKQNAFKRVVTVMTSNLAGVPSIVFGLFGLALFVNFFGLGLSVLSGSLTLSILILPTLIRTTEEALKTVDSSVRMASLALGASKWQTIWKVVLPAAFPNIMTGLILAIGRVAGETAPIIFTAAAYYLPEIVLSLDAPVMALPYHLYVMSTSGIDLNASRDIAFGTALVLMIIVLLLNLMAGAIKNNALSKHR